MKSLTLVILTLIIIILISLLYNNINSIEGLYIKKKIPYVIYKTGPFNKVPEKISKIFENNTKQLNSIVKYYNDDECRSFIKTNFSKLILNSYDILIPTAYKADLWRYCILYINGGIYGDFSQIILDKIDINQYNVDMLLTKDRDCCDSTTNIQISFMATRPKNPFYKYLIDSVCNDILNYKKGVCSLDITGPTAFGKYFCKYFKVSKIKLGLNNYKGLDNQIYKVYIPFKQVRYNRISNVFTKKKMIIARMKGHKKLIYKKKQDHYSDLWKNNKIYKT